MSKIMVVYWSGTGNTEKMAEAIAKGAEGKGAAVECKNVANVAVADLAGYDVVAFGSPSMGPSSAMRSWMSCWPAGGPCPTARTAK